LGRLLPVRTRCCNRKRKRKKREIVFKNRQKKEKKRGSCWRYYNYYQTPDMLLTRRVVNREREDETIRDRPQRTEQYVYIISLKVAYRSSFKKLFACLLQTRKSYIFTRFCILSFHVILITSSCTFYMRVLFHRPRTQRVYRFSL
jgi:Ca2+-dependent lipid-binding protein